MLNRRPCRTSVTATGTERPTTSNTPLRAARVMVTRPTGVTATLRNGLPIDFNHMVRRVGVIVAVCVVPSARTR